MTQGKHRRKTLRGRSTQVIGDRTRTVIIGVVTGVWALNFMAGLVPQFEYQPDQAINGIFMAIVGGLFALGARSNKDKEQ